MTEIIVGNFFDLDNEFFPRSTSKQRGGLNVTANRNKEDEKVRDEGRNRRLMTDRVTTR